MTDQSGADEAAARPPARHRHRDVRRGRSHGGQRPRGPRLVRRRQPAAATAARRWPTCASEARGERAPRHRGGRRRPRPRVLRQPRARPSAALREPRRHAAPGLPRADRRGARPPVRGGAPAAPAAGRRAACSTASQPSASCCATCAATPTSSSTPPSSTCTSCGQVSHAFAGDGEHGCAATVMSFGFKYGLPVDADLVFDMRFLPNPFWVPELRPLHRPRPTRSRDYVLGAARSAGVHRPLRGRC